MNSNPYQNGAGTTLDVKSRLAATHNPIFPLSSPNIDEALSPRSFDSDNTAYPHKSSNDNTLVSLADQDSNHAKTSFNSNSEKSSARSQANYRSQARKEDRNTRKRPRPGLQIVTDFSKPQARQGDVVFSQVAARRPKQARNRAISVISQKGVQALASPLPNKSSAQVVSDVRQFLKKKRDDKQETRKTPKQIRTVNTEDKKSFLKNAGEIGLSIPVHETSSHQRGHIVRNVVKLPTPLTPKIVVTPADEKSHISIHPEVDQDEQIVYTESPSFYSDSISGVDQHGLAKASSLPTPTVRQTNDWKNARRLSTESQRRILDDSSETPRPKSQGWWNLALSPMLSRAGTLINRKNTRDDAVPPVPPVPENAEKMLPLQTPMTAISPLTPRRLGLATVRSSRSSSELEWFDERSMEEDETSDLDEAPPTQPTDYLAHRSIAEISSLPINRHKPEGSAAEYYHACAVEQLANTTYFECINHSCADRLPKLRSLYSINEINRPLMIQSMDDENSTTIRSLVTSANHGTMGQEISKAPVEFEVRDKAPNHSTMESLASVRSPTSPGGSDVDPGEIVSPNLRQANTAAFAKARTVKSREPSPIPPSLKQHTEPKKLSLEPVSKISQQPPLASPGPVSPEATCVIAPVGAMPMAAFQSAPAENTVPLAMPIPQVPHALVTQYQQPPTVLYYPYNQPSPYQHLVGLPQQYHVAYQPPPTIDSLGVPESTKAPSPAPATLEVHRESDTQTSPPTQTGSQKQTEEATKHHRLGKIVSFLRRFLRKKPKNDKERHLKIFIAIILLVIVILCILFALLFTRGGSTDVTPIDSQWLNLSGYPPVPTGVSTIARPNLVASQNQCTEPTTLWSCSVPKEDQASISPNAPNQPNFRFQIRFQNGTVPANMTLPLSRRADDSGADDLFVPNPAPPSEQEQIFLGRTTDNNTQPFDGEATPFFITFMNPSSGQNTTSNERKLVRRQLTDNDPLNSIPAPAINPDGTAAPASLLPTTPFPISQPIKLYNRGLQTEHYGFYLYFDKSIFLSGINLNNSTEPATTPVEDENGGATETNATVRCTWAQTRFVVKMYTNPAFNGHLLSSAQTQTQTQTNTTKNQTNTNPSTDFVQPGSFPYPTTIIQDRHGGDINTKIIYCYGMSNGVINATQKILGLEQRGFGGMLVNPAPSVFENSTLEGGSGSGFNSSLGGMDGGSGGCGCTWQNWS